MYQRPVGVTQIVLRTGHARLEACGVSIPRITTSQWSAGKKISRSQLRPGDLVFRSGLGHVMLYAGGGRVMHAPYSGTTVQYDPLPPHGQVNGYVSVV